MRRVRVLRGIRKKTSATAGVYIQFSAPLNLSLRWAMSTRRTCQVVIYFSLRRVVTTHIECSAVSGDPFYIYQTYQTPYLHFLCLLLRQTSLSLSRTTSNTLSESSMSTRLSPANSGKKDGCPLRSCDVVTWLKRMSGYKFFLNFFLLKIPNYRHFQWDAFVKSVKFSDMNQWYPMRVEFDLKMRWFCGFQLFLSECRVSGPSQRETAQVRSFWKKTPRLIVG